VQDDDRHREVLLSRRELDQGMWCGLVEGALPGAKGLRCETHDCLSGESPCHVEIKLSA